jgi:uncharacterized protein
MSIFGGLMGWTEALVAAAIALVSGLVHGYSGFGGALLMVPLLSFFVAPTHAVAATLVAAGGGQLSAVRRVIPLADWGECVPFLAGLVLGLPIGTYLLVVSDPNFIRRFVGVTTLGAAAVLATGWVYRGRRTTGASAAFGVLSGLIGGSAGQGGPPLVAYFVAAPVNATAQRANIIVSVTGLLFAGLFFLVAAGVVTLPIMVFGGVLSLPYLMGLWIGSRLFVLLPQQNYRRATLILLFAAGLAALLT